MVMLTLIFGNEQFTISPKMDKQGLHYAVDFYNVQSNDDIVRSLNPWKL
jgi:hypothetical protein